MCFFRKHVITPTFCFFLGGGFLFSLERVAFGPKRVRVFLQRRSNNYTVPGKTRTCWKRPGSGLAQAFRCLPSDGQFLAQFGQHRPKFAPIQPSSSKLHQVWPKSAQCWPNWAPYWTKLAKIGPTSTDVSQTRPTFDQVASPGATVRQPLRIF